jgi:hypothetical protein
MSRAAPPKKKTVRLAWEPDRNRKSDDDQQKKGYRRLVGDASKSCCSLLVEPAVESRSTLIDRLVYESAPVPVRRFAIQNPEATPQQLLMIVTRAWRQFFKR